MQGVVFTLMLDVVSYSVAVRGADTECAISFLPRKIKAMLPGASVPGFPIPCLTTLAPNGEGGRSARIARTGIIQTSRRDRT
jgi:hypothetical protein